METWRYIPFYLILMLPIDQFCDSWERISNSYIQLSSVLIVVEGIQETSCTVRNSTAVKGTWRDFPVSKVRKFVTPKNKGSLLGGFILYLSHLHCKWESKIASEMPVLYLLINSSVSCICQFLHHWLQHRSTQQQTYQGIQVRCCDTPSLFPNHKRCCNWSILSTSITSIPQGNE